jgi:effector-binding domain-containing protein
MGETSFEIQERVIEPVLVAGIRMTGFYSDCGKGFKQLGRKVGRHISGKPMCLFYDGEYREGDANFEPCMPIRKLVDVEGVDVRELAGGRCLSLMHLGPYDQLRESYAKLRDYVQAHGCNVSLPTREIYHKGPGMIFWGNPAKYLTEIQFPLAD